MRFPLTLAASSVTDGLVVSGDLSAGRRACGTGDGYSKKNPLEGQIIHQNTSNFKVHAPALSGPKTGLQPRRRGPKANNHENLDRKTWIA
jgi:hypothetical protein